MVLKRSTGPGPKLDLSTAKVLITSQEVTEQDMLAQILTGFGVQSVRRCDSCDEAFSAMAGEVFDLVLLEAGAQHSQAYDLVKSLRRADDTTLKQTPIIIVMGHTRTSDCFKVRDCGANLILTKPISPQILFDHILWLAQDHRDFVESENYVGPDRRFKALGPPPGAPGRRHDDLSADIGEAKEANMSQDAVDSFFGAKKVSL